MCCYSELIVFVIFYLYYQLFLFLCDNTWTQFFLFTLFYYSISEFLIRCDLMNCTYLRNHRLFKRLNRKFANGEFDHDVCNKTLIEELENNETYKNRLKVFAVEPHGIASLGMSILFAVNGSLYFENIECLKRSRVIAHWAHKLIPFVRDIFAIFGVIDSSARTVKSFIKQNKNASIVLCPSGIEGKIICSRLPNRKNEKFEQKENDSKFKKIIRLPIFKRSRKGFIKLALDNNAVLLPTLSIHEQYIYTRYVNFPSCHMLSWIKYPFPLWFAGYYGTVFGNKIDSDVSTDNTMKVLVGSPIDCSKFENVDDLYNHFYICLEQLAKSNDCQLDYYTEL